MFNFNSETGAIRIPQGDTATFLIELECEGRIPEGSALVFGVHSAGSRGRNLLLKAFDLEGNRAVVRLTNQDTRALPVGTHAWDARVVTDPDRNEAGEIRAYDSSDNVYSIFSGSGALPAFEVTSITAEV